MKLFSLTLISVVCCFLSSCDGYNYSVTVATGELINSGTYGKVYITLKGLKGFSSTIRLHNEGKTEFQRDAVNEFYIETEDIGIPTKIRIELDCTGLAESNGTDWYLKWVVLTDEKYQPYDFTYNQWLETTPDQRTISIDIMPTEPPTTASDYKVTFETGNEKDAGTYGKVSISIYGTRHFSRTIPLHNEGKTEFQSGHTDAFNFTENDIGTAFAIRIDLDCTGLVEGNGTKWFLQVVSLEDETRPILQWFECNHWFNTTPTERAIYYIFRPITSAEYKVIVETGKEKDAGIDGDVYITLIGSKGHSRKIHLYNEGKSQFQGGQVDTFNIRTKDIGIVSKIRIELESTAESHSPNWFLKSVSLEDLTRKLDQWFPWNQWLTPTEDQKTISVDISLSTRPKLEGKQ